MTQVVVVDYGAGNIKSVQRGFERLGATVLLSSDADQIIAAEHLVLPGVGAFSQGMKGLNNAGLVDALGEFVNRGKPLLGICLGMQMLLDGSEEHGDHQGLGFIPGQVRKMSSIEDNKLIRKIPHIGWSVLHSYSTDSWNNSILKKTQEGCFFYFVHSFMAEPEDSSHILAQCVYEGLNVTAAIKKNNVTGLQFHPEKSGELGINILQEFLDKD